MSTDEPKGKVALATLPVALDRDVFLRTLLHHLAGTLEEVVGLREASGYVSIVGQRIGEEIDAEYRAALEVTRLSRAQVAEVCVDLKARIKGEFVLVEESEDRLVFENTACPFAEKVLGRTSMCMMTSNVFGVIASENLGYGKVVLEKTIARGDPGCRVVIHLRPTPEAEAAEGREYVRSE